MAAAFAPPKNATFFTNYVLISYDVLYHCTIMGVHNVHNHPLCSALVHYHSHLNIARELKDSVGEACALCNLGKADFFFCPCADNCLSFLLSDCVFCACAVKIESSHACAIEISS